MKKWLKRIRAALGMGLTWAVAWAVVGTMMGLVTSIFGGGLEDIVRGMVGFAMGGFIGGAAFSVVLRVAEGRRRFDEMSLPRFTAWGALGGLLLSALLLPAGGLAFTLLAIGVLLGGGSAAGSLALARRTDDRELLDAGEDVADIGLTEEEKRELLA